MRADLRDVAELIALLLIVGGGAVLIAHLSTRLATRAATLASRIT